MNDTPTPSSATASEVEKAVDTARIDALKEYLLKQGSEGWYGALDDLLTALSDSQRQLREARRRAAEMAELNHGLAVALKANRINGTATGEAMARESEAVCRAENHDLRRSLTAAQTERDAAVAEVARHNK